MARQDHSGPNEPAHDPEASPSAAEDASFDVSNMQTMILVSPALAGSIAVQRSQLALKHLRHAEHLRVVASGVLDQFEAGSLALMGVLEEWQTLSQVARRTREQGTRFNALGQELSRWELELSRQWDALADLHREATNHEVSARLLTERAS